MTLRDDRGRLQDMLGHSREAVEMCRGLHRDDMHRDRKLQLALVSLLAMIGEAANRVSPEARGKASGIPWPQIIGIRNRLIHAYDQIDYDVLWDVITDDLPPLISQLERLLTTETP